MEWISVNDRLPEKDGEYIVQYEDGRVSCELFAISAEDIFDGEIYDSSNKQVADHPCFYTYVGDVLAEIDGNLGNVKYWQPLPEPVSEEKNNSKYIDIRDKIWHDLVDYVCNKYHVNLEEILDEEDEQYAGKFLKACFLTSVGTMADDIGPIVSDVIKEKVNERLKELGYEQTVSSSRSEEEASDLEGNCQDGKA